MSYFINKDKQYKQTVNENASERIYPILLNLKIIMQDIKAPGRKP